MKFKTRYPFLHVLGIFGILAVICLAVNGVGTDPEGYSAAFLHFRRTLRLLYYAVFFYFSLNLYYHLIVHRRPLLAFLNITGQIILASFAYHTLLYYFQPGLLLKTYDSLPDMLCTCLQGILPMLLVGFIFAYLTNIREALVQRRILQEQKIQLEIEKAQANFNFLKAQINPHFLHNTLNFLYAKSLPYSADLSEGILTLSDIMRYALSDEAYKDGKASLADEVEHVNNVIKIHQLRFDHQLQVRFAIQGALQGVTIVPFVLITLVENAFKHGDLKDPEHPLDIRLSVEGKKLHFTCRNKKKTGPKQISTGIGLENIRKRLELTYGEGFEFTVQDESGFYSTELVIYLL